MRLVRNVLERDEDIEILRYGRREACALALDTKLFSADAATDAAPAGLLNGIAPLTAATGGDDTAALADLSNIAAAIAPTTTGLVFVAHATQASHLALRRGVSVCADVVVWPTLGVPVGTVIGLDPTAVVSGFGPEPEFRTSIDTVLHREDAAPADIGTVGAPPPGGSWYPNFQGFT